MQGRETEAIAVLKSISCIKGRSLDSYLSSIHHRQGISKVNPGKLMDLFKRRRALQGILATMVLGLGIGVAFFGMFFGVGNLGFNVYLTRWKRKDSLFAFCIISGISSIICVVIGSGREGMQIGLELASFFCSCFAYNVLMIFTIELYPTSVRNLTTSLARQGFAFGSVFVPILTSTGRRNEFLSLGIFGLTILFCGFFALILPETKGKKIFVTRLMNKSSPRWLFMQGRETEAIAVLKSISCIKGRSLDSYLSSIHHRQGISKVNPGKLMDLFKRRRALQGILATMVLGLGIGVAFFGMWKRKDSLFAFCIISGISSIICVVIGSGREGMQIGLELASFFCSCFAYNVLMIFTIELYPTSVRNLTTSLARQGFAFGSVFVPILTSTGRRNEFLSLGIFGLTILFCGFFALILPETKGKKIFVTRLMNKSVRIA
ncbi:organic cation/carnitine transporter 3 [Quercus suber]|uniref:Organic cation/carnitine transporter 3 n=1 Tax=Quercus suber TaxID=58331 RepID=A0AAW0L3A1_QUESU